ncbi:MAG: hypothetical protein ABIU09_11135 [Pyrinomonadaceae bacterium]
MKTTYRFLCSAVLLLAFVGLAVSQEAAPNPCADTDAITAADAKVRTNYPKIETLKVALDAAKEYLGKYETCEVSKEFVGWLKINIPVWETDLKAHEGFVWRKPRVEKFDKGIEAARFEDSYAAGGELLAKYPDNMNVILPLGLIGLYESYKNNFKYNDDSIRYAKIAIEKFKTGTVESKKDKDGKPKLDKAGKEVYGSFQFERNKDEALSELTYAIAYINFHAKKDRKAALPFYYEVTQMPGVYKTEPRLYATLGSYYVDEASPIGKEIVVLIEKLKGATTDEEKVKINNEIKPKVALYNGYTERALDAFGRAYAFADEKIASEKTLKAEVYKTFQSLYERRFEKKDGLDTYIAASNSKPLPNPTSEVAPIADPEPVPRTTTVTTAPTAAKPAGSNGKPAAAIKP